MYDMRVYLAHRDARCKLRSTESGACKDWT
jgi:hypothetical protein